MSLHQSPHHTLPPYPPPAVSSFLAISSEWAQYSALVSKSPPTPELSTLGCHYLNYHIHLIPHTPSTLTTSSFPLPSNIEQVRTVFGSGGQNPRPRLNSPLWAATASTTTSTPPGALPPRPRQQFAVLERYRVSAHGIRLWGCQLFLWRARSSPFVRQISTLPLTILHTHLPHTSWLLVFTPKQYRACAHSIFLFSGQIFCPHCSLDPHLPHFVYLTYSTLSISHTFPYAN